jgi:hypothetical protein
MATYLLAVHASDEDLDRSMSADDMRRGFEQVNTLEQEMRAANALLFSGRLLAAGGAAVVRPGRRRVKTTDGPYLETKEHLGGFYLVEAVDRNAALDWAAKVSLAIQSPIEVRQLAEDPRP